MKILYFVTQGEQGGAQKYVSDLALGLKDNNKIYIVTGIQKEEKDKWLFESLKAGGISSQNLFEIKNHVREIKIIKQLKGFLDFMKLVNRVNPDVIHANSSMAGFVAALTGFVTRKKVVFTVHGFFFLEPMNYMKKIFFICLEFFSSILRSFTILITEADVKAGKKFLILRNKNNYKLIYNGISEKIKEQMLGKGEARKYLLSKIQINDEGQQIVGTISNLYKTKGLEYLIDAAIGVVAQKSNVVFVVMGFGPEEYKIELQERIKKNKLEKNFFFLGKTPNASMYLKGLDLFTLTSVKEGLPYTLLEAKMAGIPILASNVGGIPEMSKNFEINLTESKNAEQISDKILDLLNKKQVIDDKLPEVYSLQNMIKATLKVYEKMI